MQGQGAARTRGTAGAGYELPDDQRERTVLAVIVQVFVAFGVKQGLDADELCACAGIGQDDLARADRHVPHRWLYAIRAAILERLPGVAVGLELGLFGSLRDLGYLGQALRYADAPLAVLQLLQRCAPLVDSLQAELPPRLAVDRGVITLELPAFRSDPPECSEAAFVSIVALLRALTGAELAPLEVRLPRSRPELCAAYEGFFGCPVVFAAEREALLLPEQALARPVPGAEPLAAERFRAEFERRAAQAGDSLVSAVQRACEAGLARGLVSQEQIAKALGMSSRSLQRRLAERGVRYQELLGDVRRAAAERMLLDRTKSVFEVACAVGYDISSFNRVFRRWTGTSPTLYRRARWSRDPGQDAQTGRSTPVQRAPEW